MTTNRIQSFNKRDEVTGNDPGALMDQLVERVLTIGPRLTPVDGTSVSRDRFPIEHNVLAIAFHRQLLQICGKTLQVLLVRQDGHGLRTKKVVVPKSE